MPFYPRIYVVIDPENQIDEIHESNNKGWEVLAYAEGTTGVNDKENVPAAFKLSQNYPNPFNPVTTINYSIPSNGNVQLKVYDILGREVASLVNETKTPGNYKVNFNANNLASGVYFYRLQAGNFIQTKKMILMK